MLAEHTVAAVHYVARKKPFIFCYF